MHKVLKVLGLLAQEVNGGKGGVRGAEKFTKGHIRCCGDLVVGLVDSVLWAKKIGKSIFLSSNLFYRKHLLSCQLKNVIADVSIMRVIGWQGVGWIREYIAP
uniref:Uncharacterized protein n=1 Tax=Romanomermis culicivorax TaxID=13658 RepID=A0A915HMK2_ROMCU